MGICLAFLIFLLPFESIPQDTEVLAFSSRWEFAQRMSQFSGAGLGKGPWAAESVTQWRRERKGKRMWSQSLFTRETAKYPLLISCLPPGIGVDSRLHTKFLCRCWGVSCSARQSRLHDRSSHSQCKWWLMWMRKFPKGWLPFFKVTFPDVFLIMKEHIPFIENVGIREKGIKEEEDKCRLRPHCPEMQAHVWFICMPPAHSHTRASRSGEWSQRPLFVSHVPSVLPTRWFFLPPDGASERAAWPL